MKPRYEPTSDMVLARCPDCGADRNWDQKGHTGTALGTTIINTHTTFNRTTYSRVLFHACRCTVCSRGGIAKLLDSGRAETAVLVSFIPNAPEELAVPPGVPADILKEFREAELDASYGAYRSACAMLRSVLEKTLTANGYVEVEILNKEGKEVLNKRGDAVSSTKLLHRIDAAANDKIITETRQQRAHENVRVLGNDVLHDEWREVKEGEFEEAHKYMQRILEDFYDLRPTVEARLKALKRIA
jgi:uncharacterized protein DUF4145